MLRSERHEAGTALIGTGNHFAAITFASGGNLHSYDKTDMGIEEALVWHAARLRVERADAFTPWWSQRHRTGIGVQEELRKHELTMVKAIGPIERFQTAEGVDLRKCRAG